MFQQLKGGCRQVQNVSKNLKLSSHANLTHLCQRMEAEPHLRNVSAMISQIKQKTLMLALDTGDEWRMFQTGQPKTRCV